MKLKSKFQPEDDARRQREPAAKPATACPTKPEPSPAAKNLALAHHIERLIERGLIADYTHAARILDVSQPRVTHIMGLLLLAPTVQEAILLREFAPRDKELRGLARIANWSEQLSRFPGHAASTNQTVES